MPELKDLPLYTKSIDDRTVTTLFSVAGNVDYAGDRMVNGAFTKTFQERGSKLLHIWAHDLKLPPIAVIKSVRELSRNELPLDVQESYPDATGGAEAVSEYIDSPLANSILAAIKAGAPLQASFAFDVLQSHFTTEEKGEAKTRIRNIKEVKAYEISTCNLGCNEASVASKSLLTITDPEELLDALRAMLTKSGARNARHDQALVDSIHRLAYDLGATNCLGIPTDEKSRADPPQSASLTLLRQKLAFLDFATQE